MKKQSTFFRLLNDAIRAYTYRSDIYAGKPAEEPTEYYVKGNYNSFSVSSGIYV